MIKKYCFIVFLFFLTSCSYRVYKTNNIVTFSKKGTNFYLIKENNQYLMIDSGTPNHGKKIEKALVKNNINPNLIKYLIVTHAHYDHAGNAHYFKHKFKTQIIAGKGDLQMINNNGLDTELCPTSTFAKMGLWFIKHQQFKSFAVDKIIDQEFNLSSIGFSGTITPLPGHTKGSLIVKTNNALFVGDLVRGNYFNPHKAKRHFFMCNIQDNNHDIKTIHQLYPNTTWYLGHGGPLASLQVVEFINKNLNPK